MRLLEYNHPCDIVGITEAIDDPELIGLARQVSSFMGGTDLNLGASFDRESSATGSGRTVSAELNAYRHPAQHAVKCAEEPPTRIVSWLS
jgi:hypothetical protein